MVFFQLYFYLIKGNEYVGIYFNEEKNELEIKNLIEKNEKNEFYFHLIEPIFILKNILKYSIEIVEQILRIDQIVFLKPDKTLEELGIF